MGKYRYSFPIILRPDPEEEDIYNVEVLDMFPGVTFGKGIDDALYMAKDLIELMVSQAPGQTRIPMSKEQAEKEKPGEAIYMIDIEIDHPLPDKFAF